MRVISQSGMVDVPYENFVFSCTKDNYIVCTRDTVAPPSEIVRSEMAKYSSREKALKVIDMLHDTYRLNQYALSVISGTALERRKVIERLTLQESIDVENIFSTANSACIFQFPSDDDLEE